MKLPAFPQALARVIGQLPVLPASVALTSALNLLAWRGIHDLDWGAMAGKRFCVHVQDAGIRAYFSVSGRGFVPLVREAADVSFTATAADFARLALRIEDPDSLFFNRRLLIEGDTDLGLRVKNLLDAVELEAVIERMPLRLGGVFAQLRRLAAGQGAA